MKKPVVDYRTFRLRKINEPQFSHLKLLLGCLTNATLGRLALHCIKMCSICQTNIIRTKFSQWETGSDLLFSSANSRTHISETVLLKDLSQNQEAQEKRNKFRRTLLWKRKFYLVCST